MNFKNPTIIVGHYGSGKTEFTANYAMRLYEEGKKLVVADMDIVNPYFRARELKDLFQSKGIRIISSNYEDDYHFDMPALATALQSCFELKEQTSIIDVGGDPAGANVLARYSRLLTDGEYNMWITVNANRPRTSTAEEAVEYMGAIEHTSKLKINGIINTTHMLRETTKKDIKRGDRVVRKLSELTGIKVIYTVINEYLMPQMKDEDIAGEPFPIKLFMRPKWL
ncbi:MAG: ATP-binding protein [Eubacteriales bacterium]|nr:ATP-binding protein [Eubacteriales bacterium]